MRELKAFRMTSELSRSYACVFENEISRSVSCDREMSLIVVQNLERTLFRETVYTNFPCVAIFVFPMFMSINNKA